MSTTLTWAPAVGPSIVIRAGAAYERRLLDVRGLGPVTVQPFTVKGPRQPGSTVADAVVPPRVVEVEALLESLTHGELWDLRAETASSLAVQPARLGESFALGLLTLAIDGQESREIDAVVQSVDVTRARGAVPLATLSAEFLCPSPWWRATVDEEHVFAEDETVVITNEGDVDAPIHVAFSGDFTSVRILNLTTGEEVRVDGGLSGADSLDVRTGFGDKRVERVTSGAAANVMSLLNVSASTMWQLRPGANSVQFVPSGETSAAATLTYRPLYAGV